MCLGQFQRKMSSLGILADGVDGASRKSWSMSWLVDGLVFDTLEHGFAVRVTSPGRIFVARGADRTL
jgi:hypothetical protein